MFFKYRFHFIIKSSNTGNFFFFLNQQQEKRFYFKITLFLLGEDKKTLVIKLQRKNKDYSNNFLLVSYSLRFKKEKKNFIKKKWGLQFTVPLKIGKLNLAGRQIYMLQFLSCSNLKKYIYTWQRGWLLPAKRNQKMTNCRP